MSLEPFYGDWRLYDALLIEAFRSMSDDELALRAPSGDAATAMSWPIWAIAGHTAGTRVYWLCDVLGLPGADKTPFQDAATAGWEDHLDHPRTASELVTAWTTTWDIVEVALATWTPAMLDEPVGRSRDGVPQHFTRRSLLLRQITHEAYHVGEIAVIQGIHGRPQIDLWPQNYHTIEAAAARERRSSPHAPDRARRGA